MSLLNRFTMFLRDRIKQRSPDVRIGGAPGDPYMLRWFVIPRNKWFNIYLHHFLHSDEDSALHDHPWINISYLIEGWYIEHTEKNGEKIETKRFAGELAWRKPTDAHRVELPYEGSVWTLFVTGPKVREWGFLCKHKDGSLKWVHWLKFTGQDHNVTGVAPKTTAPGCGED